VRRPDDLSDALAEARAAEDTFLWVGLREPTAEEFDQVASEFGLHPLAVEDVLKAHQRPKMEIYKDALFTVLKPLTYDDDAATVTADELMVFIGDSFVVTVQHGESRAAGDVRALMAESPDVLRHGPVAVLYAICDKVVDEYLEVAADLQVDLEEWRSGSSRTPAATPPRWQASSTPSSGRCWSSGARPIRSPSPWPGSPRATPRTWSAAPGPSSVMSPTTWRAPTKPVEA